MNRTIRKMQNEIIRLRRGDNHVVNHRISIQEKRRNPPQENRVRFENMIIHKDKGFPGNQPQMQVVLDDVYDEKMVEQGNDYLPDESFEIIQMDMHMRRPCIYLKKETMTLTHKKMFPRHARL
jgi:hypothetical protein